MYIHVSVTTLYHSRIIVCIVVILHILYLQARHMDAEIGRAFGTVGPASPVRRAWASTAFPKKVCQFDDLSLTKTW